MKGYTNNFFIVSIKSKQFYSDLSKYSLTLYSLSFEKKSKAPSDDAIYSRVGEMTRVNFKKYLKIESFEKCFVEKIMKVRCIQHRYGIEIFLKHFYEYFL